MTIDDADALGHARLYDLTQRLDLPLLARSCELAFAKSLKLDSEVCTITDILTDLVSYVYTSMPSENGGLRSALSAHIAKEFRSDPDANTKELKDSFAISAEFGFDVARALVKRK